MVQKILFCLLSILYNSQALSISSLNININSNSSKLSSEKIVNGQIVPSRTSFPYHIAMLLKKGDSKEYVLCGGSIIDSKGILTAGHCVFNAEYAIIIIGTHNLLINDENVKRIFVNKTDFIVHPKFNYHLASYDIAIIYMPETIEFNDFIQPVTLPSKNLLDESFTGEIGTITGHGQYCANESSCSASSVMRFSRNRIMSNEECREYSPFHTFPTETQICISTNDFNVGSNCRGDSGSALTINRNNMTFLLGISSFGNRKCDEGKPSIFTRLTKEIVNWVWKELSVSTLTDNLIKSEKN